MALGDVDVYPGEAPYYGRSQPGCYDHMGDVASCSHSRAVQIYKASISQGSCSASAQCFFLSSDEGLEICEDVELDKPAMGYWTDSSLKGLYTVDITDHHRIVPRPFTRTTNTGHKMIENAKRR